MTKNWSKPDQAVEVATSLLKHFRDDLRLTEQQAYQVLATAKVLMPVSGIHEARTKEWVDEQMARFSIPPESVSKPGENP